MFPKHFFFYFLKEHPSDLEISRIGLVDTITEAWSGYVIYYPIGKILTVKEDAINIYAGKTDTKWDCPGDVSSWDRGIKQNKTKHFEG